MAIETIFSEFEIKKQSIKIKGEENYSDMSCTGSSEEELEAKTIIKKCRGSVVKQKTKGTGNGSLKETLHVPRNIYNKMYALSNDKFKDGVYAYGKGNSHPEFSLTQMVLDEDDNVKFKAYPRCVITSGPKRKVENGQEEVPMLELGISLLPDDNEMCMYEALRDELDSQTAKKWMDEFTSELVNVEEV